MSATCQELSNLISDGAIHTAVINPVGSKNLMRKLIPAMMAAILYQRTDLDRSAFDIRKTNGSEYVVFNNKTSNFAVQELRYWIKGALQAFDKNYLRELYFILAKPNEETEVIESYKFKLKYFGNDKTGATKEDLVKDINLLLQSIQQLNSFDILETNKFIPLILLTYYDDVTPKDYEPPFFSKRDDETSTLLNNVSKISKNCLYLGEVLTGFHHLKCRSKSNTMLLELSSDYTSINRTIEDNLSTIEEEAGTKDDDETTATDESETLSSPLKIHCPCGINSKFDQIELVKCNSCSVLQHAPCLNHLYSNTIPDNYLCDNCNNISLLSSYEKTIKQIKSTYWLTLAYAYFNNVVPMDVLNKANPTHKSVVLQKLRLLQIVQLLDSEYILDVSQLERVILEREFLSMSGTNTILPESNRLEDGGSDRSIYLAGPVKRMKLN